MFAITDTFNSRIALAFLCMLSLVSRPICSEEDNSTADLWTAFSVSKKTLSPTNEYHIGETIKPGNDLIQVRLNDLHVPFIGSVELKKDMIQCNPWNCVSERTGQKFKTHLDALTYYNSLWNGFMSKTEKKQVKLAKYEEGFEQTLSFDRKGIKKAVSKVIDTHYPQSRRTSMLELVAESERLMHKYVRKLVKAKSLLSIKPAITYNIDNQSGLPAPDIDFSDFDVKAKADTSETQFQREAIKEITDALKRKSDSEFLKDQLSSLYREHRDSLSDDDTYPVRVSCDDTTEHGIWEITLECKNGQFPLTNKKPKIPVTIVVQGINPKNTWPDRYIHDSKVKLGFEDGEVIAKNYSMSDIKITYFKLSYGEDYQYISSPIKVPSRSITAIVDNFEKDYLDKLTGYQELHDKRIDRSNLAKTLFELDIEIDYIETDTLKHHEIRDSLSVTGQDIVDLNI